MKKYLFLFLVIFTPIMASAQFSPTIQAYCDLGVDTYKNMFYGGNFIAGYSFGGSFKAGVGVGIGGADMVYYESSRGFDKDAATIMPIFADFQYKFIKEGTTPYINFDTGYTLALSDNIKNPGFFFMPAFGVAFPLKKGAINVQVGYKYQKFEYDNLVAWPAEKKKTSCSEIELSIGYAF